MKIYANTGDLRTISLVTTIPQLPTYNVNTGSISDQLIVYNKTTGQTQAANIDQILFERCIIDQTANNGYTISSNTETVWSTLVLPSYLGGVSQPTFDARLTFCGFIYNDGVITNNTMDIFVRTGTSYSNVSNTNLIFESNPISIPNVGASGALALLVVIDFIGSPSYTAMIQGGITNSGTGNGASGTQAGVLASANTYQPPLAIIQSMTYLGGNLLKGNIYVGVQFGTSNANLAFQPSGSLLRIN